MVLHPALFALLLTLAAFSAPLAWNAASNASAGAQVVSVDSSARACRSSKGAPHAVASTNSGVRGACVSEASACIGSNHWIRVSIEACLGAAPPPFTLA